MSLSNILNNLDKYLKLPNWLQFVGIVLAFIANGYNHPGLPKLVVYVALGVACAGRLYDAIYP